MASITQLDKGRKRLSFVEPSGKRKYIRLGKMSMKLANELKTKVEDLIAAKIAGHPPAATTLHWIEALKKDKCVLSEKLADCGLIQLEYRPSVPDTLEAFLWEFISGRTDVKESTKKVYTRVMRHLLEFFKSNRRMADITTGEAKKWRRYLLGKGLAEATVRRHSSMARQFFKEAVDLKVINSNPFEGLPVVVHGNPSRFHFVDGDTIAKVIDACPDAEWRLLVGLARYGGLRIPSESVPLRWEDINWREGSFTVTSSKTEHHEGKGTRVVPIFPELLPLLEDAFELAEDGSEFVIQRYRDKGHNPRTQLNRIIRKAGVSPWPRLWQNLRSSRETELVDQYPVQAVTAWLGNSPAVALRHYLQVTDSHLQRAVSEPSVAYKGGAKSAPVRSGIDKNRHARGFSSNDVTVDSASRNTHLHEQVGASKWAIQDSNL
jgi:integrase